MKIVAFFNNKGGVGKTSLTYHLAHLYADIGLNVIAADFDPQSNLSSMFLDEERLEELWPEGEHSDTIFGTVWPLKEEMGDFADVHVEEINGRLGLIPGDLGLSGFEDKLTEAWGGCLDRKAPSFRVTSAFYRILQKAGVKQKADLALVDVGPNLGAINRAAVIAADLVVFPLAPDLFSLQGLRNLGPTLRDWRTGWEKRLPQAKECFADPLPQAAMRPGGYVVMQHGMRDRRPVKAYGRWMERIPSIYRIHVLNEELESAPSIECDPYCLSHLKHYRSLMPMAMEARRPMFALRPADGAIGAHMQAVQDCRKDFDALARKIAREAGIALPA